MSEPQPASAPQPLPRLRAQPQPQGQPQAQPQPQPAKAQPAAPPPPRVRGESVYDQITSMLMAVVLGACIIAGFLFLIYLTTDAYASRVVAAPLEIIEVSGGGGGSPDGEIGQTETIDVAGGEASDTASNNMETDASDFEAPSVEATPSAVLDAAADAGESLAEVDLGPPMPNGGAVASGRRASRIGTGVRGFGNGGTGDGGVRREDRWSIIYPQGQSADEYARQLDSIGVELATIAGPKTLVYGSLFSTPSPKQRIGPHATDRRLYFIWQGQGRKSSDIELLRKAGIEVGDKPIIQFYPPGVEDVLARLEVDYKGRQPAEIRVTRFKVVPKGSSYGFEVMDQQYLR